jgi:hypothetical protein
MNPHPLLFHPTKYTKEGKETAKLALINHSKKVLEPPTSTCWMLRIWISPSKMIPTPLNLALISIN